MESHDDWIAVDLPADFEQFVADERPKLVGALTLYLGDQAVAEELVQEAFIRAASRWRKVGRMQSPGGWTHRVAINLATSSLRRRQVERRATRRLEGEPDPAPVDTAERLVVREAVQRLPDAQRQAILLRYFLGHGGPAIAEIMGRSHGAVRALLKRAVAALRKDVAFDTAPEDSDVA